MNKAPYNLTAILKEWERCALSRIDANVDLLERTALVVGHHPWQLQKLLFVIHANGMFEATNAMRLPINTIADLALATIAYETGNRPDRQAAWYPNYAPPTHENMVLVRWGLSQRRTHEAECENFARFNQANEQWEWLDQAHPTESTYKPVDTTSEFIYEWSEQ